MKYVILVLVLGFSTLNVRIRSRSRLGSRALKQLIDLQLIAINCQLIDLQLK